MSRPRLLAHAFLAALLAASGPLGAQVGAYVSKFDRISPFADYGHVLSSSATGGFQEGGVTVSASFTEKSDITLGGPPAFIAMFATPLTFHIVASSEYQAPFSTDAGKTFTASMEITAVDDFKGSAPLACDLEASSVDVKQGQKATVSASLSCTATQLVWFNHTTDDSSYCQVLVDAFVVATAGSGGGTTFECWYKNRPNWDALSYFATSPTGSLGTGVPITFAGQAGITLNSTDSAQLQVSLVGEDGSTLATLPAINVTKTDALKTISLPPVTLAAVDQTLSLRLSLVGGDGKVLATAAVPYSAGPCVLTGLLRRSAGGTDWFLPDVPVSLLEGETVHGTVQTRQTGSIAPPKTEYCFAAADLPAGFSSAGKQLHLKAVLQDSLPPAMPMFTVSDKFFARPTTPLEIHWRPFSGNPSVNRKDLNVDRTADLQVPDGYDAQDIEASAEVYWHIWRQIHVMVPSASLPAAKRSPPLEIALHAEDTHYCPDAFGTRCPAASSIGVGNTDSLPGANPDVLWHEFGHHVLEEIYEAPAITPPGSGVALNHGGFANDYTSDSVEEGFATFWSAASSRLLSKDRNRELGLYRLLSEFKTEPITLETNYQASNPRRPEYSLPAPPHEELAVAGLLWDLLDTHAETETRYGVNLTDSVALGLTNVVALFDAKPNSVLKIYQTLKARYPGLAIDSVFLLHGLFYDKKGDFLYHEGDEVGRTANGGEWSGWTIGESVDTAVTLGPRPARESPKPIPGSFVKVALKGPDGSPVAVSQVEVSIEYGPGFEELSTTNTLLVTDGNVYFQMPPPDYRAKAVLRVAGSSGPALVIDGQAYWATPPGADHFAEQTFVVPPDVPQLDAVSPAFAPAGARLTLLGRNFASDAASNAVTFGSQTAN
ncbi:MAG TPA: hypothetical protein VKF32_08365, partial [Thermoanaerobaculia bacterium]|nr:hypothetical protein [Thermoanaerobaculia bacterium]